MEWWLLGSGAGEKVSHCLMGTKFLVGRVKKFWWRWWPNNVNVVNATELHTFKSLKWV